MDRLTDKSIAALRDLYKRTEGRGWEPQHPNAPIILAIIHHGFVRRADGRCGFEAMKDSHLTWTQAGHMALGATVSIDTKQEKVDSDLPITATGVRETS